MLPQRAHTFSRFIRSVPKPYSSAVSAMRFDRASIFLTPSIPQAGIAPAAEHRAFARPRAALRTESRLLLPRRAIHAFQCIRIVHHIRYPSAASVALIEVGTALPFPGAHQRLSTVLARDGRSDANLSARGLAEEAKPPTRLAFNHSIRRRLTSLFHRGNTSHPGRKNRRNLDQILVTLYNGNSCKAGERHQIAPCHRVPAGGSFSNWFRAASTILRIFPVLSPHLCPKRVGKAAFFCKKAGFGTKFVFPRRPTV